MSGANGVRFVLLGHPADYGHFTRLAQRDGHPAGDARLRKYERTFAGFVDWMPSYVTRHRPTAVLRGCDVQGRLIVCPFFPARISSPRQLKRAHDKIVSGCTLASDLGAHVVALGGFTSIVEATYANSLAERFGLTITSGNTLTAALAVEQTRTALAAANRPVDEEVIAVIGATGDIGRVCSRLFASRARRLILVARNRARLDTLREELGRAVRVDVEVEPQAALSAGTIIAAASAAEPIVKESDLRAGTIVCDVGYPKNLADAPASRHDVVVFAGGLAQLPAPIDLHSYTELPEPNLLYGCFCEGIVLAADPENLKLAASQGGAATDRAAALLDAARRLGIVPAPLYTRSRLVAGEELATLRRPRDVEA